MIEVWMVHVQLVQVQQDAYVNATKALRGTYSCSCVHFQLVAS
jgi:hypothetical protein